MNKAFGLMLCGVMMSGFPLAAADWPADGGAPARGQFTGEALRLPLQETWVHRAAHAPAPAYRNTIIGVRSQRQGVAEPATYDYAFHPVIAKGRMFYGSSTDESVTCVDIATGKVVWTAYTEGPIRFAPIIYKDNVLVCSDDGRVYSLRSADGSVQWASSLVEPKYWCVGNGKLISASPVRGGITLVDGKLYCASGVFPQQGVTLGAINPDNGQVIWKQAIDAAADGQLLVTDNTLWVPTHRTAPMPYKLDGTPILNKLHALRGRGAAQLWMVDKYLACGPDEGGFIYLRIADKDQRSFRGVKADTGLQVMLEANAIVADAQRVYLLGKNRVTAISLDQFHKVIADHVSAIAAGKEDGGIVPGWDKLMGSLGKEDVVLKAAIEKAAAWSTTLPAQGDWFSLAAAENGVVIGGPNKVVVLNAADGKQIFTADVKGEVRALALANGDVFASTTEGTIYRFAASKGMAVAPIEAKPIAADPAMKRLATQAVAAAVRRKGICVVAGGGSGQLAAEIARASEFQVVILEPDAAQARLQREMLAAAELYGTRVVVRICPVEAKLVYPHGLANLVVSEEMRQAGKPPYPAEMVLPLVQPYGGAIVLCGGKSSVDPSALANPQFTGWKQEDGVWINHRGAIPGAGEWASANGDAGNGMCSGETLVPAKGADLAMQWFGAPYANDEVDRHSDPVSPLEKNGILFMAGRANTLAALDAYNGTQLWKVTTPDSLRVLASHNPAPITCSGDGRMVLCAEGNECSAYEAITGKKAYTLKADNDKDWGYVASIGKIVIGTSQEKAVDNAAAAPRNLVSASNIEWKSKLPVSTELFATNLETGKRVWTFTGGKIANCSIAAFGGRVCFVESRNGQAMSDKSGIIPMDDFLAPDQGGAQVVVLSLDTGKTLWTKPITRNLDAPNQWITYLTATNDIILLTRTYFVKEGAEMRRGYDFEAFAADNGQTLWQGWHPSAYTGLHFGLGHGKNSLSCRPIVVGDAFYIRANLLSPTRGDVSGFSLKTGAPIIKPQTAGSHDAGCSPAIGSARALYYRDYIHSSFDLKTLVNAPVTGVTRPACWPNTLPVAGLLVAPDGSANCSCGVSYQMSFALSPKNPAAAEK